VIKFVSDLQQVSGFLQVLRLPPLIKPPRYNCNIFESGVKHHNPNPFRCTGITCICRPSFKPIGPIAPNQAPRLCAGVIYSWLFQVHKTTHCRFQLGPVPPKISPVYDNPYFHQVDKVASLLLFSVSISKFSCLIVVVIKNGIVQSTCIKRSPLGQRKSGLLRYVSS
jgi:hypothetical protein